MSQNESQEETQELQNEIRQLYTEIIELLDTNEETVSFSTFMQYAKLVNMLLEVRGIDVEMLTASHIKLLMYYYTGCRLKKSGTIDDFSGNSQVIKKQKLNELEIEYEQVQSQSDGSESFGSGIKVSEGFCSSFDSLLANLALVEESTSKKYCIGVAR
ncbi:Hypothetical protein BCD_0868 (plasmid) [Borrelia crocidurae DOU]|uniref:DUF3890 domain-containing protein n=1 Tax=Borrelia crocidurae DOU TaxID=1293575 RepID=W5SIF0_9SPIR|nr:DUF3890 domain-containing protein [Borrelia crocidurae]AHH06934.1 Hypothetical protein BCD_0868 [Borrelia crocidurae DOU]